MGTATLSFSVLLYTRFFIAALLLLHVCSAGLSSIFVTVDRRIIAYKHYVVICVAERLSNTFVAATAGLLHRQSLCMLQHYQHIRVYLQ